MLARLKFLTAGESHGQGLLGILDGMLAGLEISEDYIGVQLARRQMGYGRGGRMKIEKDHAEIWCGVRHGKTLGAPVGLIIRNKDWDNWTRKMSVDPVDGRIRKVILRGFKNTNLTIFGMYSNDPAHGKLPCALV